MNKIIVSSFYLLCILCVRSGFSQNTKIDSLKNLLSTAKGIERMDLLHEIAAEYYYTDASEALPYVNEAINYISQIRDSSRIVRAYRSKAKVLYRLGRYNEIIPVLNNCLSIARRNRVDKETVTILNMIGIAYIFKGEYSKALECFLESLVLRESSDGLELDAIYNNIGLVYYKMRNNEEALEYYHKSLQVRREDNRRVKETLLINIGLCYCELKDYSTALQYINAGLLKCVGECAEVITTGQFALGMTKFRMYDLASSEIHLDSSLLVSRNNGNTRFIAENLAYLSRIYVATGRYQMAERALKELEAIVLQHDYKELQLDTYRVFIDFFTKRSQYKNLSDYFFQYSLMREKLYGQELLQNIAAFKIDLEYHENAKAMKHQQQLMVMQKSALAAERTLYYGLGFIVFLLGVIIMLVYRQFLYKRKVSDLLAKRVVERSSELFEKQRQLEYARNELRQFARPLCNGIMTRFSFLMERSFRDKDSDIIAEYTKAVHNTVAQMKRLVNMVDD